MLQISVSLMNRLNKTWSGTFAPCMISLLLKDLFFQNLFIFTAAGVKCCVAAQTVTPYFLIVQIIFSEPL